MSDIRDHYDHGPIVKPEPVDGGMRAVAFVVVWVVLCVVLAMLLRACGAWWR